MFLHIFTNRLKCLLRDRQALFWTAIYPLVLATLFGLAFSNIGSANNFNQIPIGVVDNAAYRENAGFQAALASVSDGGDALFKVTLSTKEQADQKLKLNEIQGYIVLDGGAQVVVKASGINQSILKEFADTYLQQSSAYAAIVRSAPGAAGDFRFDTGTASYLADAPGQPPRSGMLVCYFALIAMAALFGGFWGQKEINDIQADFSPQAARVNLGPVHKLKVLGYSFCASIAVHFLSLLVLVAYLALVIGVDFGGNLGFILLASFAGSVVGVLFGALITVLVKRNASVQVSALVASSLILSFLAGLMILDVKYIVTDAVPLLAWINPANLLSDAFYALYYPDMLGRFFLNIGALAGFGVLFYLAVYYVTRRQRYASL